MGADIKVAVTGTGAVTAAGVGVAALDALVTEPPVDLARRHASISEIAIYSTPPFNLAESLQMSGIAADAVHVLAKTVHRRPPGYAWAMAAAAQAWHQANAFATPFLPERVGLIIGGSNLNGSEHAEIARGAVAVRPSWAVQFMDTDLVGCLSEALNIRGEGFSVGGASASGSVALIQGARLIQSGAVDACLVVGVAPCLSTAEFDAFMQAGAMAQGDEDGIVRNHPFDHTHRGFVFGEGAGAMLLESVDSAAKRNRPLCGLLTGSAFRLAAHRFTTPCGDTEARVMQQAIESAGLQPSAVDFVSAHGTGSPLGDAVELEAIGKVFEAARIPVNSAKSWIGHTLSASGIIESIMTLRQLARGQIHPTRHLHSPLETTGCLLNDTAISGNFFHALKNSFGFSGINTSILWSKGNDA
ncbi:beta-ketoacyl synthase N-terminal-like domain-containing protein [Pseudomonas sp. NFACC13-1]|uniref:beta-ketoacyl synthase N-terminal-like domain-containing protein n=1 Tax=Pseudomonas sp. NFACC13-1 TaxID=1566245 RepID=UPI00088B2950|nr:beta-ketoacyl synthase N-terminal-like domain-containing protein [Pseudomonas sp. NFACC13-1]SDB36105.1 malonyl-ACP decarboxylase [Pseudomonas sp. NFACC13-1]